MSEANEVDVIISARVSKPLYAKILKRRREAQRLTGIEPSVGAVVRAMIEEAAAHDKPKRQARAVAGKSA